MSLKSCMHSGVVLDTHLERKCLGSLSIHLLFILTAQKTVVGSDVL